MSDSLAGLAADLSRAAAAIGPATTPVIRKGAAFVQKEWRSVFPWSGSAHLPHLGASVTYETAGTSAEIGPVKGGQGSLGHLIEFGSVNNGPHPGGGPAAAKVAPILETEIGAIAMALLGVGVGMSTSNPSRYNPRNRDTGEAWPGFEGQTG